MNAIGRLVSVGRTVDGELTALFTVDTDIEALQALTGKELKITAEELKNARSLNANAYFWQLCDKIAKVVGTTKDAIYTIMLRRYGVFDTYEVVSAGVDLIRPYYRLVDHEYSYTLTTDLGEVEMAVIHAYKGSHEYNTKQMADLINGTVNDATELGIETLTTRELEQMKAGWKK